MAKIQSFPDDFVFRSKVTTGGKCVNLKYHNIPRLVMQYLLF
ncbi:hypothetical protein [Pseudoalteromonas sp. RB2-MNA-CIBAN-0110]